MRFAAAAIFLFGSWLLAQERYILTSDEVVSTRASEVGAKAEKDKAEIESMKGSKEVAEDKATEKKEADGKAKRKPPTLMRKGEAPASDQPVRTKSAPKD